MDHDMNEAVTFSDSTPKPKILMCPPRYYGIYYVINPWMDIRKDADNTRANRQWADLYELLTNKLSCSVSLIDPVVGLPDMCFTANAGLLLCGTFIPSNFRYKERSGESKYFIEWFYERGYRVTKLPNEYYFEGQGDALFCGDTLFAGYHFRSEIHTHKLIGDIIGRRVISLELVDPYFYHLDTCFCPLDDKSVLYYPEAFDSYALKVINEFVENPIPVERQDATNFGCNSIALGKDIVLNKGCANLFEKLSSLGFTLHEVELSEFIKAGGAAKCLAFVF
jgi:N-dimethylarginine dimethylaminohydrolase